MSKDHHIPVIQMLSLCKIIHMYLLSLKTTHAVRLSKWDCQVRVGQDNIRSVILTWSRDKTIFNFFLKEEPYLLDSVATTYFRYGLGGQSTFQYKQN